MAGLRTIWDTDTGSNGQESQAITQPACSSKAWHFHLRARISPNSQLLSPSQDSEKTGNTGRTRNIDIIHSSTHCLDSRLFSSVFHKSYCFCPTIGRIEKVINQHLITLLMVTAGRENHNSNLTASYIQFRYGPMASHRATMNIT